MKKDKDILRFVGKFIGPDKIGEVELAKRKTYLGKDVVKVKSEDGKLDKEYPVEVLEEIATDEKKDLTELRDLKVNPLVKKILIILLESELPIEDIRYLLQTKLPLSIEDSIDRAYRALWGKEKWEVTLLDVDNVLKGYGKREEKEDNKNVSTSK